MWQDRRRASGDGGLKHCEGLFQLVTWGWCVGSEAGGGCPRRGSHTGQMRGGGGCSRWKKKRVGMSSATSSLGRRLHTGHIVSPRPPFIPSTTPSATPPLHRSILPHLSTAWSTQILFGGRGLASVSEGHSPGNNVVIYWSYINQRRTGSGKYST